MARTDSTSVAPINFPITRALAPDIKSMEVSGPESIAAFGLNPGIKGLQYSEVAGRWFMPTGSGSYRSVHPGAQNGQPPVDGPSSAMPQPAAPSAVLPMAMGQQIQIPMRQPITPAVEQLLNHPVDTSGLDQFARQRDDRAGQYLRLALANEINQTGEGANYLKLSAQQQQPIEVAGGIIGPEGMVRNPIEDRNLMIKALMSDAAAMGMDPQSYISTLFQAMGVQKAQAQLDLAQSADVRAQEAEKRAQEEADRQRRLFPAKEQEAQMAAEKARIDVETARLGGIPSGAERVETNGQQEIRYLPGSKEFETARQAETDWNLMAENLNNLKQLYAEHGGEIANTEVSGQMQIMHNQLVAALGRLNGMGVLDKHEYERIVAALPNPAALKEAVLDKPPANLFYDRRKFVMSSFDTLMNEFAKRRETEASKLRQWTGGKYQGVGAQQQAPANAAPLQLPPGFQFEN